MMSKRVQLGSKMLTQSRLKKLFDYNAQTGVFVRNRREGALVNCKKISVSRKVGWIDDKGYLRIEIDGRAYRAHRLVWLWETGRFPVKQIDHFDGDKQNNRYSNLRLATNAQNQRNNIGRGYAQRPNGRFQAYIRVNKKLLYFGTFDDEQSARTAHLQAVEKFHGKKWASRKLIGTSCLEK